MDTTDRVARYEAAYRADYGFESVMVAARQRLVIELLLARAPRAVLEVGCGQDLLCERAAAQGFRAERWVVVEPGEAFGALCARAAAALPEVSLVPARIEDAVDAARALCPGGYPLVLCAGLLNEVPDPVGVLRALRALVAPDGTVHVNVPNARSFHRRLARAMGLITDLAAMTERNQALLQYRVYDPDVLRDDVARAGLRVVDAGGYFVKPFTHRQMESLGALLTPELLAGLDRLGREHPDWASEIYVNAAPA